MHAHAPHFLREYFAATGWSLDNHYADLTLPSRNLLDFPIPPGLHVALSHRPTTRFASSLSLSTLVPASPTTYPPTLAPVLSPALSQLLSGQLTYAVSSVDLNRHSSSRRAVGMDRVVFEDAVRSFCVAPLPVRPVLREGSRPTWSAGERVDGKGQSGRSGDGDEVLTSADFLLYGRVYAPAPRIDALYVHRLSATLQSIVSLVSVPSPPATAPLSWPSDENGSSSTSSSSGTAARLSEIELKLQQDTGRWSSEYSYAVGDGMWGARGLYNFGKAGGGAALPTGVEEGERKDVDHDENMSSGLKGRWSAGGEVFFSAQERSAGVSTGVRFSTLPETNTLPGAAPSQPPTTITATLNPIMGHLSTAYAVAISPNSSLASRFDFNLFSYDADLTIGGEWLQRQGKEVPKVVGRELVTPDWGSNEEPTTASWDAFGRGIEEQAKSVPVTTARGPLEGEVTGVIKFRASTNTVRPSPSLNTADGPRISHCCGRVVWETFSSRSEWSQIFVSQAQVGNERVPSRASAWGSSTGVNDGGITTARCYSKLSFSPGPSSGSSAKMSPTSSRSPSVRPSSVPLCSSGFTVDAATDALRLTLTGRGRRETAGSHGGGMTMGGATGPTAGEEMEMRTASIRS